MTVTSFSFLCFLLAGFLVYYIAPKKLQWIVLLLMSIIFYCSAASAYTILFLVMSTILAYISGNMLEVKWIKESAKASKIVLAVTFIAVFLNILMWFLVKGSSFWILASNIARKIIPGFPQLSALPIASALGMGYYTAQVIGYILDCYWKISKPQKNIFKLFLFVAFFPQLTVGPISKYSQLECLFEKHAFSYKNLCFGCQRILWGFFKKLVISDRVGLIINGIWSNAETYTGFWPWIAVFLYPLQIYTDFSGCMDIILGVAELFDIHLQENFKNPFFSRSIQEFWQRWHITLGAWAKDYVYYPVLKSKFILSIGKWSKKHFSKRIAKFVPWTVGMGILWFVMGFWHGSVQHILGVSVWFWTLLVIGELCAPISKRMITLLHIDTECFSWHLFQSIRTYVLYALGVVFFSASGLKQAIEHYIILFHTFGDWNPWIFFDGSITGLGVTLTDVNIIIMGVFCLFVVANLREKYGYARTWIEKQILPFRWFIWIWLFVMVLIYGMYGPGYDASAFIYEGF